MRKNKIQANSFVVTISLIVTGLGVGWLLGLSVSPVVSIAITSITGSAALIIGALSGLEDRSKDETDNINKPVAGVALQWTINPLPLALLILGITIGSMVGVLARNYHWLGSDVSSEIEKWTDKGIDRQIVTNRLFQANFPYPAYSRVYTETLGWLDTNLDTEIQRWTSYGLSKEEVARKLFEIEYPTHNTANNATTPLASTDPQGGTVLYAEAVQECGTVSLASAIAQKQELTESDIIQITNIITTTKFKALIDVINDAKVLGRVLEVLCS